jgi:phosphatidylserine/phosphatidylglycerophosphate/cardiolipin synthase-like enzyme
MLRKIAIFSLCVYVLILFSGCSDDINTETYDIENQEGDIFINGDSNYTDINPVDTIEAYGDAGEDLALDIQDVPDINQDFDSPQFVANRDYLPLLKRLIQSAEKNIVILHQEFLTGSTLDQLQSDLISAKKRGVDVTVLLEKDVSENASRVNTLKSQGINASLDTSSKTLHLKLFLSDNKYVLLGSTNLSISSFQYNNEVNYFSDDTTLVSKFYEYARGVLANNSSLQKIYCSNCEVIPVGDSQYDDLVVPYINSARKRLYIIIYQFDYDTDTSTPNGRITNAILDAKSRGLDVKILLEYSSFDQTLNSTNQRTANFLKSRGIDVRFDSKDITTHAKLLIADDRVVIYSGNWMYSALTSNHEVGVIVNYPGITQAAVNYFNSLFNSSK